MQLFETIPATTALSHKIEKLSNFEIICLAEVECPTSEWRCLD